MMNLIPRLLRRKIEWWHQILWNTFVWDSLDVFFRMRIQWSQSNSNLFDFISGSHKAPVCVWLMDSSRATSTTFGGNIDFSPNHQKTPPPIETPDLPEKGLKNASVLTRQHPKDSEWTRIFIEFMPGCPWKLVTWGSKWDYNPYK